MVSWTRAVATASLAVILGTAAAAQNMATPPLGQMPGYGSMQGMRGRGGPGGMPEMPQTMRMMQMMQMMQMMGLGGAAMGEGTPMGMMTEHVEGHIAFLRAELQITPAQGRQWDEFAGAMRTSATRLRQARPAPGQGANLSQRLAYHEEALAARLQSVRAMRAAYDRLYATLTPSQKTTADQLVPPHLGMGGMPMGMGG